MDFRQMRHQAKTVWLGEVPHSLSLAINAVGIIALLLAAEVPAWTSGKCGTKPKPFGLAKSRIRCHQQSAQSALLRSYHQRKSLHGCPVHPSFLSSGKRATASVPRG